MKLAEKARRTGITYAEALDATLIAAAHKAAGGANVFYMGDTRDKGREFLDVVRQFAEGLSAAGLLPGHLLTNGKNAGRLHFSSGFRVEALSSRPENIRGLQGVVVIDEAAFHADVDRLLDAVTALLIWGGRVRVISTHNGTDSPFNGLVEAARAGRIPMSVHRITFADAVEGGLYRRLCLQQGIKWSAAGQRQWVQEIMASYGTRHDARMEELDVLPRQSRGRYFSDVLMGKAACAPSAVLRFNAPQGFDQLDQADQHKVVDRFIHTELQPALAGLDRRARHVGGEDFGRQQDRTVIMIGAEENRAGATTIKLMLELSRLPYEAQRRLLFAVLEATPNLGRFAMDATGNGAWLAEVTQARFGSRIVPITLSGGFYDRLFPAYRAALESGAFKLPDDEDLVADHRAVRLTPEGPRMARGARSLGRDGRPRHGDAAIAALMVFHAGGGGQNTGARPYTFQSAGRRQSAAL